MKKRKNRVRRKNRAKDKGRTKYYISIGRHFNYPIIGRNETKLRNIHRKQLLGCNLYHFYCHFMQIVHVLPIHTNANLIMSRRRVQKQQRNGLRGPVLRMNRSLPTHGPGLTEQEKLPSSPIQLSLMITHYERGKLTSCLFKL